MALRFYHDAAGTQEITDANPDHIRKAVPAGQTLTDVAEIHLKSDNPAHEYEEVDVFAIDAPSGTTVEYSESQSGPWSNTLSLADGTYTNAKSIWRRVTVTNVQDPALIDTIKHRVTFDAYVAE